MDKDFSEVGSYASPRFQTKTDRIKDPGLTHIVWNGELGRFVERPGKLPGKRLNSGKRHNQTLRLAARDGWKCFWCGCVLDPTLDPKTVNSRRGKDLPRYPTIDHLIERANGGSNKDSNCVLSCGPCNNARNKTFHLRTPEARGET